MVRSTWIPACLAILVGALVGGCLDVEQQILVRPDGTGTITQTVYISKDLGQQMAAMADSPDGQPAAQGLEDRMLASMMDESQFKDQAQTMGQGVTFQSVQALQAKDGRKGFRATFQFEDVSKVQMAVGNAPEVGPGMADESADKQQVKLQFTPAKGDAPAKLVMNLPEPKVDKNDDAATDEMDPMAGAMAMQFMKDLKMRMSVKVDGKITSSSATHVDKAKGEVTIMSIDLGGLAGDEKLASKAAGVLQQLNNPQRMKDLLSDPQYEGIDRYIKLETKGRVVIEFTEKTDAEQKESEKKEPDEKAAAS